MANSDLRGKYYNIRQDILDQLQKRLNSYSGNKKKAIGYVTIKNLISSGKISYDNAKKIINTYKKASNAPKDELTLYLFGPLIDFINGLLERERTGLERLKQASEMHDGNAHIKRHEKDRPGIHPSKLNENSNKKIFLINENIYKEINEDHENKL